MKNCIALFAVICIVGVYSHEMADKQDAKNRQEIDACITESKVQPEILEAIRKGEKFTMNRELDCFSTCILKKIGIINQDGTVSVKPTDSNALKECKKLTGKDECETGGKIWKCFACDLILQNS